MRTCLGCLLLLSAGPLWADDASEEEARSLTDWVKLLDSAREGERIEIIDSLAQYGAGAKVAVPALLRMLKERGDGNATPNTLSVIGQAAVEALAQIGPAAVPALLQALDNDHPRIRGGAALALGYVRPRALHAVAPLKKALADDEEFVRVSAAMALWRLERNADSVVPTLAASLRSMTPALRQRAVLELGELGPPARAAIPALIAALRDEYLEEPASTPELGFTGNMRPVSAAVRALAAIGPASAPALVKAAGDRNPNIRTAALLALASLPASCKEVTPALSKALEDRDSSVRLLAAINLRRRNGEVKTVLPVLLEALKGSERELADAAALALAQTGEPGLAALPSLLEQQARGEAAASAALMVMGKAAIPGLIRELADEDYASQAAKALYSMMPHSLKAVLAAIESDKALVRARAAEILAFSPAYAARAVPALREAARDIDSRVRYVALVGLAHLDLEGPADPVAAGLAEFVKVKDSLHRRQAIVALGSMRQRASKAVPVLFEASRDPDVSLAREANNALNLIREPVRDFADRFLAENIGREAAVLPRLVELLQFSSISEHSRARIFSALVPHAPAAIPLLVAAVETSEARSAHALWALGRLGPSAKAALPALEKQLKKQGAPLIALLQASAQIDPENLNLLRKGMLDQDQHGAAFVVLTELRQRARPALPELRALLARENPGEGAVRAYIQATGRAGEALPVLHERMKTWGLRERRETASQLGELAACDPEVLPLVIQALGDRDVFTPLPLPPPGVFSNQFGAVGQMGGGQLGAVGQLGGGGQFGPPGIRGWRDQPGVGGQLGAMGARENYANGGYMGRGYYLGSLSVRQEAAAAISKAGPAARAAVPVLMKMLGSDLAIDRNIAAAALGAIGPRAKEAAPALRKALADYDRSVRIAAARALSQLDPEAKEAIPLLLAALPEEAEAGGPSSPTRDALVRFGKSAVPVLIAALRDREPGPHVGDTWGLSAAPGKFAAASFVAETLGLIGPDAVEAVPALLEALQDLRPDFSGRGLRPSAAAALGKIGPGAKPAAAALLKIAHDPAEASALRLTAAEAAWRIEQANVVSVVRELLHAELLAHAPLSSFAFVKELGPARKELAALAAAALTNRLEHESAEAARILGWLGKDARPAPPALRKLFEEGPMEQRTAAALALWKIEGKGAAEAVRALLEELRGRSSASLYQPGSRSVEIVALLGGFGSEAKAAVPLFEMLLDDLDPLMRVTAAVSLWQLTKDEKRVLPVLRRGQENGSRAVRRRACEGLAQLGPAACSAIEALKELRDDPEQDVRAAAAEALKQTQ